MTPSIYVRNRQEAIDWCGKPEYLGWYDMVSISTPGRDYDKSCYTGNCVVRLLETAFFDVGVRDPKGLPEITDRQAYEIACFVKEALDAGRDLVVHCDGGMSRSAAVARAVADYAGIDFSEVDSPRTMYPNYGVYKKIRHWLHAIDRGEVPD